MAMETFIYYIALPDIFIFPYSIRMREHTDHKNSEYRHFSRSEIFLTSGKTMFKLIIETLEKSLATPFHYLSVFIPVTFNRFFLIACLSIFTILSIETTSVVRIYKT